ncbi:DUF7303 family protein [Burkholderia vietnamiensis]|uniref:DUF7303 family protein n=1 Tax=Burkholderia vietnamiensis TaxID=60552 RepID=UPI001CF3E278|nr:hypothetical protein [Burkholderia vietnamiensis]MCA7945593.1 hypothetical protein [Burkholderia vietnamiensis]HDR9153808.1 hypothetical protein [Burkholderia vietnamiensis]
MGTPKASLSSSVARHATKSAREFVIEKGLPIPAPTRGRPQRYPFSKLEIGDSFFVEGDPSARLKELSNCANYHRRFHGGNFVVRAVDGGVRVWRIAPINATNHSEHA